MRPPRGIVVRSAVGALNLDDVVSILGEASIPERALMDGLTVEGDIRAVLLVENLGAWQDMPAPPGWLLVHLPGWDTPTVLRFLAQVERVPIVHFGDLDPNGVRIFQALRDRRPDIRWFVPTFWREFVERYGLPGLWPKMDLAFAPALVRELARQGRWLEQETIVLDPRLGEALELSVGG